MSKRIVPFGDRILVSRRTTGNRVGDSGLVLPDQVADRPTDVADVIYVADHTFCDKALIEKSSEIIDGLSKKAMEGDSQAVISLLRFNDYLKIKSIQKGDVLLIGKYCGTDFKIKETGESLTVLESDGIYALIEDVA